MAESNNVKNLFGTSIDKIREMVDANTVIGDPITTADGTMIIPVSKIAYGFASGGSDLPSKTQNSLFGGAGGAGINITPIAFLVFSGGSVRVLPLVSKPDTVDRAISMIPDLVDKIGSMISGKTNADRTAEAKAKVEVELQ